MLSLVHTYEKASGVRIRARFELLRKNKSNPAHAYFISADQALPKLPNLPKLVHTNINNGDT